MVRLRVKDGSDAIIEKSESVAAMLLRSDPGMYEVVREEAPAPEHPAPEPKPKKVTNAKRK